jgi:hypothetical protein
MLIFPALKRLRQKDLEVKASLGYIVRPYFKKRKERKKQNWCLEYHSGASLTVVGPGVMKRTGPSLLNRACRLGRCYNLRNKGSSSIFFSFSFFSAGGSNHCPC